MTSRTKVSCVLCDLSDESSTTGALSTKGEVVAHQNCLLFSSGIYCKDSPQFDDLFGFSVEDVLMEVKRGRKLTCSECKKKGATAGCEVRRCKKSYHYPCAVRAKAEPIEDEKNGNYVLYCSDHKRLQSKQSNGSVNELASSSPRPSTSKESSEAGSSKVCCLVCEKTQGINTRIFMLYCDKRASSTCKGNTKDDTPAAGASVYSSDSRSPSSVKSLPSKRRKSDEEEEVPSKRKSGAYKRIIRDDSLNSDDSEPNTEMEMYAPLESDIDESANSARENHLIRKNTENPTGSTSGNQLVSRDEDETIMYSDAESQSLLPAEVCRQPQSPPATSARFSSVTTSTADLDVILIKSEDEDQRCSPEQKPVYSPDQHDAGPSVSQQAPTEPPPSPVLSESHSVAGSPPCTSTAICPGPPETICVSPLTSSPLPCPVVHPSESSIDSVSFWKSCNAAGCTQAIFSDFIHEMNEISSRIQSDQASQEDCDLALKVLADSGKLTQLVAKQEKELQRKQRELKKAAAAIEEVVSALKR